MKIIIAGGRNYSFTGKDIEIVNALHKRTVFTEVVSGGASGADNCGEVWAQKKGISVMRFPADWSKNGRAAGPIRNRLMAKHADAAILFPGGSGTFNMRQEALRAGLLLWDFSVDGAI